MNSQGVTHFRINHIDDVLPHIEGRTDFIVAHKDGYSVIDYVYALPDSFDHPARLECRGIKFDSTGNILARPLHKFMNVGQTPDTQPDRIDFRQPHTITEKLDGSMIHPAIVNGEVVFMTRMGRTDVAVKAERHLPEVADFCRGLLLGGATPIFEWTAPDNRIVVRYEESRLTLLAVRNNVDGEYWPRETMEGTGIPLVPALSATPDDFLAYARAIQDAEGFVVRFDNGLWVKVKGDDYVLKHKAKDGITQEKNILALVLNGGLDDVLPLLDEPDANAAREYAASVEAGIAHTANWLWEKVANTESLSQKEFALTVAPKLDPLFRSAAFMVRSGNSAHEVIRARIAANTNSSTQVEECRPMHGARWSI
jgi:RNA ligase